MTSIKVDGKRGPDGGRKRAAIAEREALELIAEMRRQLDRVRAGLDLAEADVAALSTLTKQVARLRLMSDDLASAAKFAAKLSKD